MKRLNLDHLATFAAVAECGSFSAAAERLHLTQPAVSQQIRQFERSLGVTLIERIGRKAGPTAAGADLLAHVGRIDAAVSAALETVAGRADGANGRVRLGTGATACIFLLPPLLKKLRRKFPGLEITVTTGNATDIAKAVEENILDLGLVTLPLSGRSLEITPVLQDEFLVVAPRSTALPRRLTAAALAEMSVLLFEPGGNTRRLVDAWLARSKISLTPVMSLGSVEAIKEMVAAGLGCAILPAMAVPSRSSRGGLAVQSLTPRLHRTLAVVIRRDKRLCAGLREMYQSLKLLGGRHDPADFGRKRRDGA